jgi:hypothetical protein
MRQLLRRSPIGGGQFSGRRASPLPLRRSGHVSDCLFEGGPIFTLTEVPIPKLSHKAANDKIWRRGDIMKISRYRVRTA